MYSVRYAIKEGNNYVANHGFGGCCGNLRGVASSWSDTLLFKTKKELFEFLENPNRDGLEYKPSKHIQIEEVYVLEE